MPHLIIEHSPTLTSAIRSALSPLHQTLLASGQFGERDIKVRARMYEDYLVGGQAAGDFVHLTLYLLDGRSAEVKADLSRALMAAVQNALAGVRHCTSPWTSAIWCAPITASMCSQAKGSAVT